MSADEGIDKDASPRMQELQRKWKDEYADIGDRELQKIIAFGDMMKETEPIEISKGFSVTWKPLSNKNDKIYKAKRRQWEAKARQIAASSNDKKITDEQREIDQVYLENMVDDYYAELMELFFNLPRNVYDEMPPSDASLAVEAALHHLRHPLPPKPASPSNAGSPQELAATTLPPKKVSGSTDG